MKVCAKSTENQRTTGTKAEAGGDKCQMVILWKLLGALPVFSFQFSVDFEGKCNGDLKVFFLCAKLYFMKRGDALREKNLYLFK